MSEQTLCYDEKQSIVDQFIIATNPYKKHENMHFDLRAYAKFIKDNNISASEVTDEILNKFCLPTK